MSMIKRATGRIEQFTDAAGEEVQASEVEETTDTPEPQSVIVKDVLEISLVSDVLLDPEASDTGDDVIAKDC
jgi:hypothetical protein